jgi:hypothetical protein
MNQIVDSNLRSDQDVYLSVRNAATLLQTVAGETMFSPTIRWNSVAHPTPQLEVVFEDEYGTYRSTMPVKSVTPDKELHYRMIRLWGDFLADRSKVLMNRIENDSAATDLVSA